MEVGSDKSAPEAGTEVSIHVPPAPSSSMISNRLINVPSPSQNSISPSVPDINSSLIVMVAVACCSRQEPLAECV